MPSERPEESGSGGWDRIISTKLYECLSIEGLSCDSRRFVTKMFANIQAIWGGGEDPSSASKSGSTNGNELNQFRIAVCVLIIKKKKGKSRRQSKIKVTYGLI